MVHTVAVANASPRAHGIRGPELAHLLGASRVPQPGPPLRHARPAWVRARGAAGTVKVTVFSFPAPRVLRCGARGMLGPAKVCSGAGELEEST